MLYKTAFKASPSVVEILNTVRNSRLGTCKAPCQVPTIFWANSARPGNAAKAIIHSNNFFMATSWRSLVYSLPISRYSTPLNIWPLQSDRNSLLLFVTNVDTSMLRGTIGARIVVVVILSSLFIGDTGCIVHADGLWSGGFGV